jgi:hypothetical protein
LRTCPCLNVGEARSFGAVDPGASTVALEMAYVTARHAALALFGTVAELLSVSGAPNGAE